MSLQSLICPCGRPVEYDDTGTWAHCAGCGRVLRIDGAENAAVIGVLPEGRA